MIYSAYDVILENSSEEEAIDYARGFCWGECDTTAQTIKYGRYIDTVNGIDVFYDFGADYYFFCDSEGED